MLLQVKTKILCMDSGSREECLESVDLIVCVGGDGTLLYTSSLFQVCGVHLIADLMLTKIDDLSSI